jgi:hypothetical protein
LKNASLVVRGINSGVDGFNRWSFTNRGDLDGQWQLVRTWDVDRNQLLDSFVPQPNAYYQFAMLSRYLPRHSGVLASRVEAPFLAPDRKLVATALASGNRNITILVVNESYRPVDLKMELEGLHAPLRLLHYSLTKETEDKGQVDLVSDRSFAVSKELSDRISPTSIVVYSTYSLGSDAPGLVTNAS